MVKNTSGSSQQTGAVISSLEVFFVRIVFLELQKVFAFVQQTLWLRLRLNWVKLKSKSWSRLFITKPEPGVQYKFRFTSRNNRQGCFFKKSPTIKV